MVIVAIFKGFQSVLNSSYIKWIEGQWIIVLLVLFYVFVMLRRVSNGRGMCWMCWRRARPSWGWRGEVS